MGAAFGGRRRLCFLNGWWRVHMFRRFNTVYYRLLSTYILLTVCVTTVIGAVAYRSFSRSFQGEADRLYSKVLGQFDHTLDVSLVQKTNAIYGSLLLDNGSSIPFLMQNTFKGSSERVLSVYRLLRDTVSGHSALVDSIHVYFARSQLLVSSQGVKYLDGAGPTDPFIDMAWLRALEASPQQSLWMESRNAASGARVFSLVKTVPYPTSAAGQTGAICINIREAALQDIIQVTGIDQLFQFMVVDAQGALVVAGGGVEDAQAAMTAPFMEALLALEAPSGRLASAMAGVDVLVYFGRLPIPSWRYVAIVPLAELHSKTRAVGQTLLVCCLAAIGAGILAANLFSSRLYSPLKAIISRLGGGHSRSLQDKPGNEYALINSTIQDLSIKVRALERTLHENRALIEHSILDSLLSDKGDLDRIRERMRSVDMPEGDAFVVALFCVPRAYMDRISAQTALFVQYALMDAMRAYRQDGLLCYAIGREEGTVAAIVWLSPGTASWTQAADRFAEAIVAVADTRFSLALQVSLGSLGTGLAEIRSSYAHAQEALRALYLWPQRTRIAHEDIRATRMEGEAEVERLLNEFARSLRYGNEGQIKKSIHVLLNLFRNSALPFDYAYQKLMEMVLVYIRMLKSAQGDLAGPFCDLLYAEFVAISDIDALRAWFLAAIDRAAALAKDNAQEGNARAVKAAQAFIQTNLSRDLSLTEIADSVKLSPNYFGKLFKEATGRSCLTYIMELRMDRARILLLDTSMKVEAIALQVGYRNPAYFIKLFKQAYGVTPKQMRLSALQPERQP